MIEKPAPGWKRARVDWLMDEVRDTVSPEQLAGRDVFHYSIPVVAAHGDGEIEDGESIASSKLLLKGGELLISKLNPRKSHILIARAPMDPTVCSGEFVVLRPRACDVRFMFYAFVSELIRQELDSRVQSVTKSHQRVAPDDIAKLWISVPELDAQRAIAGFLDRETARIDEMIRKKRSLIRLIRERLAAVISSTVQGFDTEAKDASVGRVPRAMNAQTWKMVRLKYLLRGLEQGWSPQCESRQADPGEWGVLKVGCVKNGLFYEDENKALPAEVDPAPDLEVRPGDILMSRANTRELLGSVALVPNVRSHLLLCDKLYRLTPDDAVVNRHFLVLALRSSRVREQLEAEATGASSSMQNIEQDSVRELLIATPPIEDQRQIAKAMDEESAHAEALVKRVAFAIERLEEHRQALITAAVTGQIDIGSAAA